MDNRWVPADRAEEFYPNRWDIYWNGDYSAFIPSRLLWWDEGSYAEYQGDPYGE